MLGPRLTFREITIPIAVIASLIAYWVLNPWASAFVSTASIPVAVGFVIGYLVRHGDQKIDGYSMMSPPILLILIHAGFGVACFALTIFIPGSLSLGFTRASTERSLCNPHAVGLCDLPGFPAVTSISSHGRNPHAARRARSICVDLAASTLASGCRARRCIRCAGLGVGRETERPNETWRPST